MTIRFLNAGDVEAYRALRLSSLTESPFAFSDSFEDQVFKTEEDFQREIEQQGSPLEAFALGAFTEAHELIGFVKFKRDRRTKARHRASLLSLYVEPKQRGKGIAKQLVQELVDIAGSVPGLEQVQLSSIISETSPIAFYEALGFEILGGIIKKDLIINGRYVDAVYMVKHLNQL